MVARVSLAPAVSVVYTCQRLVRTLLTWPRRQVFRRRKQLFARPRAMYGRADDHQLYHRSLFADQKLIPLSVASDLIMERKRATIADY